VIRDVARQIALCPDLAEAFAWPLALARRVKDQRQRERGRKVYSLPAPEVEGIGKGKAHQPDEFGVKVSVATPLRRGRGGQVGAHGQARPGHPDDGPTLARVIPAIEATVGAELARIVTKAGSQGHHAPKEKRFRVSVAGHKRGLTGALKRAFRRRAAVEPVIGISRPSTAWAATISPPAPGTRSTPCWRPWAITSGSSSAGWRFCRPCSPSAAKPPKAARHAFSPPERQSSRTTNNRGNSGAKWHEQARTLLTCVAERSLSLGSSL
jgi:hypothetical protein